MDSLESYLQEVMDDMNKTWPKYKDLEAKKDKKPIQTHPIPFFGDIKNAKVLTVGVNPSATEFYIKRNWPDETTAADLRDRLINYFQHDAAVSHQWFETWEKALVPLSVSYQNGDAAHIDLSPRATKSMGSADPYTFLTMMKADVRWFFELLLILSASNVPQLMLISGTVTKCYYMDQFIKRVTHEYGFQLEQLSNPRKKGFGFNRLRGPGVDLPVFFSSLSPSSRTKEQKQEFIDRVKNNQLELRRHINKSLA